MHESNEVEQGQLERRTWALINPFEVSSFGLYSFSTIRDEKSGESFEGDEKWVRKVVFFSEATSTTQSTLSGRIKGYPELSDK